MACHILLVALLALASSLAMASDPSQLQDFCVADRKSPILVNGFVCKPPMHVTADDFFLSGLDKPGNTSNQLGSKVTQVTVNQLAGLNTLGISLARIDFAPYEGTLYVGFVTSNTNDGNVLFTKILNKGDVFVFPQGLIHFQFNHGTTPAVAIAALSSQNPGVITIANAVFGSNPPISDAVLAKAFQVGKDTIKYLQAQFWMDNN